MGNEPIVSQRKTMFIILFLMFKGDIYMFNNPYAYNQQMNIDKLNEQINNLEKLKAQMQQATNQQPSINQTFQLAPTNRDVIRYASSIDEVQRDIVIGDTPYFSKDMSVVWIKNTKGEIKTYELNEIIEKDSKDLQIEFLQEQIDELKKGMKKNEQSYTDVISTENTNNSSRVDEEYGNAIKDEKPTIVQRVSTSKKGK